MKTGRCIFRVATCAAAVAAAALTGGCAALGLHVPMPMETVQDEAVSIPAGTYLSDVICRAAGLCKWSPTVMSDRLVRCRFSARSWSITLDVQHNNRDRFSIAYVDSTGLFYDEARGTIHRTYNNMLRALCQQIREEAILTMRGAAAAAYAPALQAAAPAQSQGPGYSIASFEREGGDDIAYVFELNLTNADRADFDTSTRIQDEIREAVRREYTASSSVDPATIRIAFPEYRMSGGKVKGRAVVLTVELLEFVYSDVTRHGRLSVRVNPKQYEVTRQWVRDNIAALARDRKVNIGGSKGLRIGSELLHDNNVLEVEFHAGM